MFPRGLEYALLATELAAKTSHGRLWKAETLLEKLSFTCFLILPVEIIDNQIDDVAITNNCQKRPQETADWSGSSILRQVLKHLLGVVQPGLATYHKIALV